MQSLRDSSISQIEPVPGLFVSDRFAARSLPLLQSLNIQSVLSVTQSEHAPKFASVPQNEAESPSTTCQFVQKYIDIDDDPTEDLICHLKDACDWIEARLKAAPDRTGSDDPKPVGVLVHCTLGMSRSGAVVVAYLMRSLSLEYPAALILARESRSLITPNPGFEYQLRVWQDCDYDVFFTDLISGVKTEKARYQTLKANRLALVSKGEEAVNRIRFASMAKVAADFGKRRTEVESSVDGKAEREGRSAGGGQSKGKNWENVEKMEQDWTRKLIEGAAPPWLNKDSYNSESEANDEK